MRIKRCQRCGKTFTAPTGHREQSLCDECRKKVKHNSVFKERICKDCGATFMGYPRSFYCPSCKEKRLQKASSNRSKTKRPLGSIDICMSCGKEYVVKSGRQKYCPECAKREVKKNISKHKKEYNAEHQDQIRKRKRKVKENAYICPVCGKPFTKQGTNSETCSPKCAEKLSQQRRAKRFSKNPKRKSGVVGVRWNNGRWSAYSKSIYIGTYASIAEAANAIENYKKYSDVDS